jgi:hypothetical protein
VHYDHCHYDGRPNYQVDTGDVVEPLKSMLLTGSYPPGLTMIQALGSCFGEKVDKDGLEFLLRATKRFQASDPRDKIYAMLGLAPERYRRVTPDYTIPLGRTLMELVKTLIEIDGNLNILLGNRFKKQDTQPHWIPEVVNEGGGEIGWVPGENHMRAAGGSKPMVDFDFGKGILRARGFMIGKIKEVIGPWRQGGVTPGQVSTTQELIAALGHHDFMLQLKDFRNFLATEAEKETFWRTLVLDQVAESWVDDMKHPAPEDFGLIFRVLFTDEQVPEKFMPGASHESRMFEFIKPVTKCMEHSLTNRCFFTTYEGHMGLGPFCTKPQDVVVMLYGGAFCFILRDVDLTNKSELIGDAYVHGVMHGELEKDRTLEDAEVFELC